MILEGGAEGGLHLQLLEALHGDPRGKDLRAVASAVLDAIHGEVGVFEEAIDVFADGKEADADAGGDDDLVLADANGLGDGGEEFFADIFGVLVGAKIGEEDNELVSAHAADGVGLAHAGFESFGDLAEDGVSGLVAEGVVHAFEVVEVDHEDCEFVLGAGGALDGDFEAVAEQSARGQAGEMVVVRDVIDVLFCALALGEVVGDPYKAGDGFVAVAERGDDELDRDARAVLANVGPLSFVDEPALGSETEDMMIGIDLSVELY